MLCDKAPPAAATLTLLTLIRDEANVGSKVRLINVRIFMSFTGENVFLIYVILFNIIRTKKLMKFN